MNSSSADIDFIHQNLTSTDVRFLEIYNDFQLNKKTGLDSNHMK